jgi:hypothetical protein
MSGHAYPPVTDPTVLVLECFVLLQRAIGVRSVVWGTDTKEEACERLADRLVYSGVITPEVRDQAVGMLIAQLTDIRVAVKEQDLTALLAN